MQTRSRKQGTSNEPQYDIQLSSHPQQNNQSFNKKISLSRDALLGYLVAAMSFLGDDADTYFRVYDSRVRPLNTAGEIKRDNVVLVEGEQAFDFTPGESWIQSLRDVGGKPIKEYTARIDTPQRNLIVQFNDPAFIDSFAKMASLFGSDDVDAFILNVYHGDNECSWLSPSKPGGSITLQCGDTAMTFPLN